MHLIVCLIILFRYVNSVTVHQTPPSVSKVVSDSVELKCMVEVASNDYMYWYRQYPGKELQLLFYSSTTQYVIPDGTVDGFTAERPSAPVFNLKSSSLQANHSAVYYCAWSLHNVKSETIHQNPAAVSKFPGEGVKLECNVEGSQQKPQTVSLVDLKAAGSSSRQDWTLFAFIQEKNNVKKMYLFLSLMTLLPYVKTARVVQTPSSISRSLGKAVELRCTVKGESSGHMFWYRQYPGKELQLMFYSAGAEIVNEEGAADGFTATRPSGSDFNLESRNLQAHHSAVYYCAWSIHSDSEEIEQLSKTPKDSRKQLSTTSLILSSC
ncbi:uncharacterized protein LOC122542722 [Chiloscyllium plagiosum]|uniref:uncharacterized protein LOC122542722 n=1 Tax=Chiloscyllium plagiosum TaxID=36176 RepID=UPI001CB852A7|nr:uncharacterized protein LOC122542722 [Chiloscyllium plagiosum]